MNRRSFVWILLAVFSILLVGCKKKVVAEQVAPVPAPRVTEASTNVQFTWIDERGEFHVEQRATGVPEASREIVRVRELGGEPLPSDNVFIADLRALGADGAYPVRTMSRQEFEDIAVSRRSKTSAVLSATPPSASGSGPPETGRPTVIIYGASWCGPCHQAADYLKQKGVAYVLKDIEKEEGAQREMQAKLAKAGRAGGSIPVIDVRGRLLVGFDPRAVDRALAP